MKPKTFKIAGSISFFVGILFFGVVLYAVLQAVINDTIYSLINAPGALLDWGFLIVVPLLFVILGACYFWVGHKKIKVNKLISVSAIIQLVSSIIGAVSMVMSFSCVLGHGEFCGLIINIVGIPVILLLLAGIVLLIAGLVRGKHKSK